MLRIVSNALWVLLGGFWLALLWGIGGVLLCISIVGIPLGLQCFKAARLSFFPFGKRVHLNYAKHPIANTLWAIFGGWEIALAYLLFGVLNCVTVIGIPTGIHCFKLMKLAFFPFGASVRRK